MTKLPTLLRRAVGALLLAAAPLAGAAYFEWETVELPAASGASCGNGTPYRFFVNRTPFSSDLVMVYEGGGACWDQNACNGIGKLSASNPNGVPADYLAQLNTAAFGLVTPFSSRINPFQQVQTQAWNIVFLPYCTGDVHSGSKLTVYADADPSNPRTQYHRGAANIRGAAAWLRTNLGQPRDLLLTGFSAGGVGSTTTYALVRDRLAPTGRSSLIADSGLLMQAPRGGSTAQYPSQPLQEKIRVVWGLDAPDGLVTSYASLPAFDSSNLGTVNRALALRYAADRFAFLSFRADMNFSAFSYEKFYPDISNAPTPQARIDGLLTRWNQDLAAHHADLAGHANVTSYQSFFRDFNESHCLTVIDFTNTGIEELGIPSIAPVVDGTLNRAPPARAVESFNAVDLFRPLSFALILFKLLAQLI